jgi:elongation factor P hydroxylase
MKILNRVNKTLAIILLTLLAIGFAKIVFAYGYYEQKHEISGNWAIIRTNAITRKVEWVKYNYYCVEKGKRIEDILVRFRK